MRSLDCDVLIVGSGAAGGTLAGTLSELTGLRIVVLEKGGWFDRSFFNQREWDMRVLYAEDGARFTHDGAIPVRGGECVGGGTTVNVALCFDPVRSVWERWARDHGLHGFSFEDASDWGVAGLSLARCVRDVRARIGVHPPDDREINRNNASLRRGCEALGIRWKKFELNMRGCIGCGFCSQGCAYDAKQGTMVTYLADAVGRGVTVVHHAVVDRLTFERRGDRLVAVGAEVRVRPTTPGSRPSSVEPGDLRVHARLVVVAAGAIETPLLLQRSEHPDPYDQIGRGLVLHPSLPIIGMMNEEIAGHRGIEGSVYSDHFFESHAFYFECLFGHPLYGSALLPGIGAEHFDIMLEFRRLAGFGVMLIDTPDPDNRVVWSSRTGSYAIRWRLGDHDARRLRIAARKGVEVMFAAGAREVLLPSEEPAGPLPTPRFRSSAQAVHTETLRFLPHQTVLTSAHCQSTTRMGEDPRRAVISSRCESHWVDHLLVIDSSSFPGSCGANPMVSIMSLARYQGRRIAAELARYGM
jgi:choline dehydrogenase-like flavoprotein